MLKKTKFIAIGRGASGLLVLVHKKNGIPEDKCLSLIPFVDEHQHFINASGVDLTFEVDTEQLKTGNELYKASLMCEQKVEDFFADAEHIIIVCCLGTFSGLIILPKILHYAEQKKITVSVVASTPFTWEGSTRATQAKSSVKILQAKVKNLAIYNMDKAMEGTDSNIPTRKLFQIADKEMLDLIQESIKYAQEN